MTLGRIGMIKKAMCPLVTLALSFVVFAQNAPAPRIVDLKSADGTLLKATYFAAGKPGPGVILYHQSNRTRTSWDDLAGQLAAIGINTLTVDTRGYGQSGGIRKEATQIQNQKADLETVFRFLASQPTVRRDVIGSAGTGWLGVDNAIQTAALHPNEIKSLVLMSAKPYARASNFSIKRRNSPNFSWLPTATNIRPPSKLCSFFTQGLPVPPGSSSTIPWPGKRLGSGMRPVILAKFPPRVVTAPISSRATRT